MLRGALAAAVTPLSDGGENLDEQGFEPLVRFLSEAGLDGLLALGTTGEGIMLSSQERRRAAELFVATRQRGFAVAVQCGAQTTRETAALAAHAAEIAADAVAVIGPPYFAFDEASLLMHFRDAARACSPVPFYVYELRARTGYAVPVKVIERLREEHANFRGMKVSDTPFDQVEPYLLEGLDVFVGSEPLVLEGLRRGAVGTVSGIATAFPEIVVALVRERSEEARRHVRLLRARLDALPFHSAAKAILAARGVPIRQSVRAPLREVSDAERRDALALLEEATRRGALVGAAAEAGPGS